MTNLSELASRVEALQGPDREVDLAISAAINYKGAFEGFVAKWGAGGDEIEVESVKEYTARDGKKKRNRGYLDPAQFVPRYTASLDAAKTLASGRRIILNIAEDDITTAIVDGTQGCANTPALALTAAALRARDENGENSVAG